LNWPQEQDLCDGLSVPSIDSSNGGWRQQRRPVGLLLSALPAGDSNQ